MTHIKQKRGLNIDLFLNINKKGTLTADIDSTGENKTEYNINENTGEVQEKNNKKKTTKKEA
ncbi:MAG: hypothetical protein IJC07_06345 [Clostridia bacterium]|nr:hypothetical protein [Clostridia bacterium]